MDYTLGTSVEIAVALVRRKEIEAYVFFFSSRRRHTRLQGDWSSDVCSSDLAKSTKQSLSEFARDLATTEDRRAAYQAKGERSEERRVGKEGRSRGSPYH